MADDDLAPPGGASLARIFPILYQELRRIAESHLQGDLARHSLTPTALVHEVFLKLAPQERANIRSHGHFLAIASQAMRWILVDHARRRIARKRGGAWSRVTLLDHHGISADGALDALVLELALEKLEKLDPEAASVVTMRFYGGMTELEIAAEMERSERWVRDHWRFAKAWLQAELTRANE